MPFAACRIICHFRTCKRQHPSDLVQVGEGDVDEEVVEEGDPAGPEGGKDFLPMVVNVAWRFFFHLLKN